MINHENIVSLRMERQYLTKRFPSQGRASEAEYDSLYKDTSPGQNVYWNGFGDPPSLTFRADFNDIEYNRKRQRDRVLVKGRFQGRNLGWIEQSDMELFSGMCRKPIEKSTGIQKEVLELLEREGPMNIALIKEITGMLVKEITPALHKLQEAFLIFEDQYDGEWDRAWYLFGDMFPEMNIEKYTRLDAMKIILQRFAYRHVMFDVKMAKSFYKFPEKEIKAAVADLVSEKILLPFESGYILASDYEILNGSEFNTYKSVYVLHRNDFLVKSNDHVLKAKFKHEEFDTLYYILIDGEFRGAVVGHFKNGPYVLEDVTLDLPDDEKISRKDEIIEAIFKVNNRDASPLARYCGQPV